MIPVLMILLAVAGRLLPHPPNLAPQGAVAVFAGRTLRPGVAIALTLGAMLLGDLALARLRGLPFGGIDTVFVYAAFAIQALLGGALRRRRGGALAAAALGAGVFFVLSNFGVWLQGGYGYGLAGLAQCYMMALPFFGGTLLGDVAWTVALTLVFQVVAKRVQERGPGWVPVPTTQTAAI